MKTTLSIRKLEPATASRIAAGEVVDRPLSALKEILENALDAGARSIEVRVEKSLDQGFQVADDGIGIDAGELELALERHATSKIEKLEDLDRLGSLGFRGEALPSIAAVSRLKITSRPESAESAGYLVSEGGAVVERGEAPRAPGTTVEVSDLFFNTPARRKFMHSTSGELRAAFRMIECYALAYPEVALRLTVDGKERFHWPGVAGARRDSMETTAGTTPDPDARRQRASVLWGSRHAAQLIEAGGERDGIGLSALLGLPEHGRANREGQIFLVNRRWIQSPLMAQALRQAYGNLLPGGRYPSATLWLRVPPQRLDVNVHPTKREVRFADEGAVFSLIAGVSARALTHLNPPFTVVRGGMQGEPSWSDRVREKPANQTYLGLELPESPATTETSPLTAGAAGRAVQPPTSEPELWQLHRTYILAPVRGGLVIIDQHAAHERILYEATRARLEGQRAASQQLMFHVLVDLTQDQFELMLELGPWLRQLGWDLAMLGPPTVVIQGMPDDLKHERPGQLLQDILDAVSDSMGKNPNEDMVEHVARSHACHTAVRAGDALDQTEMKALVDRLFATSRPHGDPHGRVTFVRLDLDELHRRFGRT